MVHVSRWWLIVSKLGLSDEVGDVISSKINLRVLVVNEPESVLFINQTVVLLNIVVTEYLSVYHFLSNYLSKNLLFNKLNVIHNCIKVI